MSVKCRRIVLILITFMAVAVAIVGIRCWLDNSSHAILLDECIDKVAGRFVFAETSDEDYFYVDDWMNVPYVITVECLIINEEGITISGDSITKASWDDIDINTNEAINLIQFTINNTNITIDYNTKTELIYLYEYDVSTNSTLLKYGCFSR